MGGGGGGYRGPSCKISYVSRSKWQSKSYKERLSVNSLKGTKKQNKKHHGHNW